MPQERLALDLQRAVGTMYFWWFGTPTTWNTHGVSFIQIRRLFLSSISCQWLQWHTLAFEPPKKDYTPFLGWLVNVCGRCRDYIVECESIHMHLSCQHLSIVITLAQVSSIVGRIFWSLNRLGARPGDPQTWDVSPDCETETQRSRPSAAQTLVGGRSRAPSWLAHWGSSERSNQTMHLHSPPNI